MLSAPPIDTLSRSRFGRLFGLCLAAGLLALPASTPEAHADPCGMVPPITPGGNVPIARVGYQQTYVFFKDGMETFVIHPGFNGKVEEFGMLIPFPSVPALRKVPDATFDHLAKAVDPPEVLVDLRPRLYRRKSRVANFAAPEPTAAPGLAIADNEVRVVKQEAVGMYEVTVLQAGSAKALNLWMDDHEYVYPKGMDDACNDYVKSGWCFVAVKSKVGQKDNVDPKPGQRSVNTNLPNGASFDGHVQAMGFRFPVEKMVVPMRLSTFNEGDLHNVVYILSDSPMKITGIPEEFVVRQIDGEQLHKNLVDPLPLRIIGGTADQIPEYRKKSLLSERNPHPHNGVAKDLFAGDLLAYTENRYSHPHEEAEKMLLMIGERLSLRGNDIDQLNEASLKADRDKISTQSLENLKKDFTLTVVDGNFPRELLSSRNLEFASYRMPSRRNSSEFYDAVKKGPGNKRDGNLFYGALSATEINPDQRVSKTETPSRSPWVPVSLFASVMLVGLVFIRRSPAALAILIACSLAVPAMADDEDSPAVPVETIEDVEKLDNIELIDRLADPKQAEAASDAIVKRGEKIVPDLIGEAIEGNDMALRGWAIVCISEIGGDEANKRLTELHQDQKQPILVRTWAAAGRVHMTSDTDELIELANLIPSFPALGRPIGMKIVAKLNAEDSDLTAEGLLSVSMKVPQLQQALTPAILNLGPDSLIDAMSSAKDQNVRRQAAAYLATLAQQDVKKVSEAVVAAYDFDPAAKDVPWAGGPLFIPGLQWAKEPAKALVADLVAWHLWADINGKKELKTPIHNNLRSLNLAQAAGYQSPGFQEVDTKQWLTIYKTAYGNDALKELLTAQKVQDNEKYKGLLD